MRYRRLFSASSMRRCRRSLASIDSCCTCILYTETACDMVSMGCESSADHGGRRCAKGEVRLKFVVNVNVASDVNTP